MSKREHITEHKGPVCDFCLKPDPRWSFDGPDPAAGVQEVAGQTVIKGDSGVWAACTACSNLVKRGRAVELAKRAARYGLERLGLPLTEVPVYAVTLSGYYAKVLPGLGPRRVASKVERESPGGFVVEQIKTNPNSN